MYKVVKISLVTLKFKKGVYVIFAATEQKFDDSRSFGTLANTNGLKYYHFDFSRLSGTYVCTCHRNLVRYG